MRLADFEAGLLGPTIGGFLVTGAPRGLGSLIALTFVPWMAARFGARLVMRTAKALPSTVIEVHAD